MSEKNYLNIAYRISRECCDWMHQWPNHIYRIFDRQTDADPEFLKTNLMPLIYEEKAWDIPFGIRIGAKYVIERNELQGIPFKEFAVYNKDVYTVQPHTDNQSCRIQTDKAGSQHRESEQTICHNFVSVTIIETQTERFKGPVFQTRLWPVDVARTFREIDDIKDRNHPTRLLSLNYGFIRDFNYHTHNYITFFGRTDGRIDIDVLNKTTNFNGQRLDRFYPTGKIYKHSLRDHSQTREWYERNKKANRYKPGAYLPIIIDDIEEASLNVTCNTKVVDTPETERTIIHHHTDKKDTDQTNEKSIEQTLMMTSTIITDKYELVVPFTQIRRWPQACEKI